MLRFRLFWGMGAVGWHRVGDVEGGSVQLVLRGAMGWLVWGSGVGVISLAGVHGGVEGVVEWLLWVTCWMWAVVCELA